MVDYYTLKIRVIQFGSYTKRKLNFFRLKRILSKARFTTFTYLELNEAYKHFWNCLITHFVTNVIYYANFAENINHKFASRFILENVTV